MTGGWKMTHWARSRDGPARCTHRPEVSGRPPFPRGPKAAGLIGWQSDLVKTRFRQPQETQTIPISTELAV